MIVYSSYMGVITHKHGRADYMLRAGVGEKRREV